MIPPRCTLQSHWSLPRCFNASAELMRRLLCFLLPRAFTEIALKYASYRYMPFLVPRPSSSLCLRLSTGAELLQLQPAASVAMRRCMTVRRQRRGPSYGYGRRGPATSKASRRRRCPSNSVGLHAEYTVGSGSRASESTTGGARKQRSQAAEASTEREKKEEPLAQRI
jgi:hypothetical protein